MESEHKFMLNDILRKKRKSKMRKPEYPVFLTYGPIHVSPLGWIKRWKEDIICICQRLRYGYCYRDAWAIDQWFLVIIPNMLNDLRINGHGYPGSFTGTEEENVRKWNRILEHMEFLFREANEETCHRKNPYEEAYDQAREAFTRKYGMFGEKLKTEEEKEQEKDKGYYCVHTMSDVPEYKEILDQWFAAEKELAAYRDRSMKEGMKLLPDISGSCGTEIIFIYIDKNIVGGENHAENYIGLCK